MSNPKPMLWVIQNDLFQQNERPILLETLERFDIPHQLVEVRDYETIPAILYDGPIITNGSIMLSEIALRKGWYPGSLMNENFSYEIWHPHFSEHLLNREAVFTTIGQAAPRQDIFFIRPLIDDKSFTGRLTTLSDFLKWQTDILAGKGSLRPDMKILHAPIKQIGQEHRHFIIDQEVVSSSRYKLNGQANYSSDVDFRIINFANQMANIWQPARAFVLDTYVAGDEIGIVELGGICHAGFYAADVQKIIMTLDGRVW